MKVVLDTNIWLSSIFWEGEANKLVRFIEENKIEIIITKDILEEIMGVLNREEKFQKYIINKNILIKDLIKKVISMSILIQPESNISVIKDHPPYNRIIEAAFDGKAKCIISYDKHLLNIKEFKEIKIVNPGDFFEYINMKGG